MMNTISIHRYPLLEEAGAESGGGAPVTTTTAAPKGNTPSETPTPAPAPEYTPAAAAALEAEYALTPAAPAEDPPADGGDGNPPAEDYSISLPENFGGDAADAFIDILNPIAKESGVDGKTFGDIFARSYQAIEDARQRAIWQERFQQSEELKTDWGADYEANMAVARNHVAWLRDKAGLTDEDLSVFQSPKGMRALYAMASARGERPAAGLNHANAAEKSWAESVLRDPNHPDHAAFFNPSDPRYKELNDRWNRAMRH